MQEGLFSGSSVRSNRVIYTPSAFARSSLLHLQETGELQALRSHVSSREGLDSCLFFVVVQGSGELMYRGIRYPLRSGDCVFVDCRQAYSHTPDPEDLWQLKWAHFYGPSMPEIYAKYTERGGQPVFRPDNVDRFAQPLSDLLSLAGSGDYIRDMHINETLSALLTRIMAESWNPEHSTRAGLKKQSLQALRSYLDTHYSEHITLDGLAENFFINKFYLTRVFREQFGTTILAYLDHLRVTRAKQLLRFTDLRIEEVGRAVGIEDPAYFNRVFRKVEGIAPGEYRKLW